MRVIAGSAKRILLKSPLGLKTRPTSDRIKETLFNMLNFDLYDKKFLDLFAGSGGIGIEALSRGAKKSFFVEKDKEAITCIEDNLKRTALIKKAEILFMDVSLALKKLEIKERDFDFIFLDPPYNKGLEIDILEFLSSSVLVSKNTLIIIEVSKQFDEKDIEKFDFRIEKIKDYKTSKHIFIRKHYEDSDISR